MKNWQEPFKDKKITVMGLGLLGRGIADVRFLHEAGAKLTVTDLKTEAELKEALTQLSDLGGVEYVLGEHRMEDFENCDYVLKAASVPLDSPHIAHAKQNNVPVKMDESWVAELLGEKVTFVGVTGTRGKSTLTLLLHHALKEANASVHLGGNVPGAAMLPLLKEIQEGDVVVMELSSWQLQGWQDEGLSPHVSVFTNFMEDHLNYYKGDLEMYFNDKAAIFSNQSEEDILVISPDSESAIEQFYMGDIQSNTILAEAEDVPADWKLSIPGEHFRQLSALAIRTLEALGFDEETMRRGIETFKGPEGRLQYIGEIKGAQVYNDNNATTPAATKVALEAVGSEKNVVLIMGGTDKNLSFEELYPVIERTCKQVVLMDESGSRLIEDALKNIVPLEVCDSPVECVDAALRYVGEGDILLYSPAFASFGKHFNNEYDRGSQFVGALSGHLDTKVGV